MSLFLADEEGDEVKGQRQDLGWSYMYVYRRTLHVVLALTATCDCRGFVVACRQSSRSRTSLFMSLRRGSHAIRE